jgi:hypothetical protein
MTMNRKSLADTFAGFADDEAIGRQVGKGEKTVRRYIEAMYEMTGTDCPFALGVAVATRGRITSLKGSHA